MAKLLYYHQYSIWSSLFLLCRQFKMISFFYMHEICCQLRLPQNKQFCKNFRVGEHCCEFECLDPPGEDNMYQVLYQAIEWRTSLYSYHNNNLNIFFDSVAAEKTWRNLSWYWWCWKSILHIVVDGILCTGRLCNQQIYAAACVVTQYKR